MLVRLHIETAIIGSKNSESHVRTIRVFLLWPNIAITEEASQIETKHSDSLCRIVSRRTPMQLKIERRLRQADSAMMVAMIVSAECPATLRCAGRNILHDFAEIMIFHTRSAVIENCSPTVRRKCVRTKCGNILHKLAAGFRRQFGDCFLNFQQRFHARKMRF